MTVKELKNDSAIRVDWLNPNNSQGHVSSHRTDELLRCETKTKYKVQDLGKSEDKKLS